MRIERKIRKLLMNLVPIRLVFVKFKFKNEQKLLNNININQGSNTSILHFTINKSATQTFKSILSELSKKNELIPVFWTEFARLTNNPTLCHNNEDEVKPYLHIFKPKGFFYGSLSGYISEIPDLPKYKIILVIRDPRDIIVSNYFSYKYSHLPPPKYLKREFDRFIMRRDDAVNLDIDHYTLKYFPNIISKFVEYDHNLIQNKKIRLLLIKYEELLNQFEMMLDNIISFCEFKNFNKNDLISRYTLNYSKENIRRHNRKGIAGDYKNKLNFETINQINEKYGKIISKFGY